MRKLMEAIEEAEKKSQHGIPVASKAWQDKAIAGLKRRNEDLLWRLEGFVIRLKDEDNTASAASIENIIANLQQANRLFDAAKADIGKEYEGFEDHDDPKFYK